MDWIWRLHFDFGVQEVHLSRALIIYIGNAHCGELLRNELEEHCICWDALCQIIIFISTIPLPLQNKMFPDVSVT